MTIPVIDLGDRAASALIAQACRDTGFLVVTNHGVDQVVIDTAWAAATKFFDLAVDDKMAVAMPYPGYPYGYAPMQGERLAASLGDDTPPDLKETFSMGPLERTLQRPADDAEAFVYEATPWPPALPEFQPALEVYYSAMSDFVARVMALFAEALQLPSNFFDSRIGASRRTPARAAARRRAH
jgi:isopenicillin N synthase-like dioxygenase